MVSYITSHMYGPTHTAEQAILAKQEELKNQALATQEAFINSSKAQEGDCTAPYFKSLEAIHDKQEECTQELTAIQERKAVYNQYLQKQREIRKRIALLANSMQKRSA